MKKAKKSMKKRFSTMKIVFVSTVGSLMLLLGLLAFPGTASAYSGNVSAATVAQHSQLSAYVVGPAGRSSVEVRVSGSGFRSNSLVYLSATENGRSVSIQPTAVRTNWNGSFSDVVRIQLPFQYQQPFRQLYQYHPTQIVLHATGRFGQSSSQVLLLNQYQYGLIH
jgi:hypothetical protein